MTTGELVLSGDHLALTLNLSPADLIPTVLGEASTGRVVFRDPAEVREQAGAIGRYVTDRVHLKVDGAPVALSVASPWPLEKIAVTVTDSTGKVAPALLPITLLAPLSPHAQKLDLTVLLFGEGEFIPLFDLDIRDAAGRAKRSEYLKVNQPVTIALEPFREGMVTARTMPQEFVRFLKLGFTHIVPLGLDHILFVLGLFLLGGGWRALLKQVTAFTIAHSLTLALAMLGIVRLPSRVVEPLIALSITFVAVENVFRRDVNRWRWMIVFGFGLVHGLGFAGVLSELGLPRNHFLPALIGFNLGVEGGQLTVIALATLATLPVIGRSWYRAAVARPASLAIAAVGLVWAVQRIFG